MDVVAEAAKLDEGVGAVQKSRAARFLGARNPPRSTSRTGRGPITRRPEPATLPYPVTQEEAEKDESNDDSSGQHLPGTSTCRHLPILVP